MTAPSTDSATAVLRVDTPAPPPLTGAGVRHAVAVTLWALPGVILAAPAAALWALTLVSIVLSPLGIGLALAHVVVRATELLARGQLALSSVVLGERLHATYDRASGFLQAPVTWARDPMRWRAFSHLAFAGTGGLVMSALPAGLLAWPVTSTAVAVNVGGLAGLLLLTAPLGPLAWWFSVRALVRARAVVDRAMLTRPEHELAERVEQLSRTRTEALDHSAAEIRRIERDLHDGAQARLVSVGMSIGLAEELLERDPALAATLLREARAQSVDALDDIRSVVHTIHPPVLADRGLVGAVQALAAGMALPVEVESSVVTALPAPVESAVYFGVAEMLANAAKHAAASRARVTLAHGFAANGGDLLTVVVEDDGRGGADPAGAGIEGVRRRLAAFDGRLDVVSPAGGPTVVRMEVPCASSSPRTT